MTATRGSWERLLNELREAGDIIEGVDADDATRADGYRAVLTMLSAQIEMQTENHPLHPRLTRVFTPTRRYFGDHPDAVYHYAPLAGDRRYRLHGFMGNPTYFAVTVYAGSSRPGQGRVAAHLHGSELLWNLWTDDLFTLRGDQITLGPDGSFELVVAAGNPGVANWLDTSGREVGTVMFRWMEAAERVPRPNLEVFELGA